MNNIFSMKRKTGFANRILLALVGIIAIGAIVGLLLTRSQGVNSDANPVTTELSFSFYHNGALLSEDFISEFEFYVDEDSADWASLKLDGIKTASRVSFKHSSFMTWQRDVSLLKAGEIQVHLQSLPALVSVVSPELDTYVFKVDGQVVSGNNGLYMLPSMKEVSVSLENSSGMVAEEVFNLKPSEQKQWKIAVLAKKPSVPAAETKAASLVAESATSAVKELDSVSSETVTELSPSTEDPSVDIGIREVVQVQKTASLNLQVAPRVDYKLFFQGKELSKNENGNFTVPADVSGSLRLSAEGYLDATKAVKYKADTLENWTVSLLPDFGLLEIDISPNKPYILTANGKAVEGQDGLFELPAEKILRLELKAKDYNAIQRKIVIKTGSRNVWKVNLDKRYFKVPEDYNTIQAAIDDVSRTDAVVLIGPGSYEENLVSKNGITLKGDDYTEVYISPRDGRKAALLIKPSYEGNITGITFEAKRAAKEPFTAIVELDNAKVKVSNCRIIKSPTNGLLVNGGSPEISQCVFYENKQSGILVRNKGAMPTLLNNHLWKNVKSGIRFEAQAKGTVSKSICEKNDMGIVVTGKGTSPVITKSQFTENKKIGIVYLDGATGTASENLCERNDNAGIGVYGKGTNPILSMNESQYNKMHGMYFAQGAKGKAFQNICLSNQMNGIYVLDKGTSPVLDSNVCMSNADTGITFAKAAMGIADKNTTEANKSHGIRVMGEQTKPTLSANISQKNFASGIAYFTGASGKTFANKLTENRKAGIYVDNASPILEANECMNNGTNGIEYKSASAGRALNNTCKANMKNGISISGIDTKPILEQNTCIKNLANGLAVSAKAQASVSSNTFTYNEENGILVSGAGTAPDLNKNQCVSNKLNGMSFIEAAVGSAKDNTCKENTLSGISISGKDTAPDIISNRSSLNADYGLFYKNSAHGNATANACNKNNKEGIMIIGKGTAPVLTKNSANDNWRTGIYVASGALPVIKQNLFQSNNHYGMLFTDAYTNADVEENKVTENHKGGIIIGKTAQGTFIKNEITKNGDSGIILRDVGTKPTLEANKCLENDGHGIEISLGAAGRLDQNNCDINEGSGIHISGMGSQPVVNENTCWKNDDYGIYVGVDTKPVLGRNTLTANKKTGLQDKRK